MDVIGKNGLAEGYETNLQAKGVRVALIRVRPPRIIESWDVASYPHPGLAYIAAYLRSKGIDCKVYDAKFDPDLFDFDDLKRRLLEDEPDIIGFTAMTHEIDYTAEAAVEIKKISPESVIVIGGVHVTALPRETLLNYPVFDIAVFGEGEHTAYELAKAFEQGLGLEAIAGIVFRRGDDLQVNESREWIRNLDELPFPAWDLFPRAKEYPVLTSRGCPFQCVFCMRVLGNKLRKRSAESVVEEIERMVRDFDSRRILFRDQTFGIDRKHLQELLDLLIAKGLHRKIKWMAQTRVDLVDYEILLRMKEAGCDQIDFGVESGNPDILKIIRKGITPEVAVNAVALAKKVGLECNSFFIIGHPFETFQTVQDTVNLAIKLNTTNVAFGIMVPYPGTEVYQMAKKGVGGYRLISKDWRDFNKTIGDALDLRQLDRKTLERLQLLAYFKFYLFNFRIMDLMKLFVGQRKVLIEYVKKLLGAQRVAERLQ